MKCILAASLPLLACWTFAVAQEAKLELSAQEKQLLDLTNAERKKKDLPALKASPSLFRVARAHAQNMARQEKMEHTLDGKNPVDRLRDAGYKIAAMAENIGWIDERISLERVMRDWMGSEIHRNNILNKDLTEIGIGVAKNAKGQIYCVQDFGRPQQ